MGGVKAWMFHDILNGFLPVRQVESQFKGSELDRKRKLAAARRQVSSILSEAGDVDPNTIEKIFTAGMVWEGSLWAASGASPSERTKAGRAANTSKMEANKAKVEKKFWEIYRKRVRTKGKHDKTSIVKELVSLEIASEATIWKYLAEIDADSLVDSTSR